jgi:cardiolipin synthase
MKTYSSSITNISNLLSLSRIVLLIPFYFVYVDHKLHTTSISTIVIFTFALVIAFTDYLDGYFARRYNQISELGKILDPLADKVAIIFMAILLSNFDQFPLWIVYIIIGRDILILLGAFTLMGKMDEVPSSEWPGKITSGMLTLLFITYLAEYTPAKVPLEMISIFMIAYSFLDYILKFIRLRNKN